MVAYLAHALGEAYATLGDFERAEMHFQHAVDYYRRDGMRPYLARTLASLAELHTQQGRQTEAQQTRGQAEELTRNLEVSSC